MDKQRKEHESQVRELRARVATSNEAATLELPVAFVAYLLEVLEEGRESARALEAYRDRVDEYERTLAREEGR